MRDLVDQLIARGFKPREDFDAQDDSDGRGPFIRAWRSPLPCPFPELHFPNGREPIEPPK